MRNLGFRHGMSRLLALVSATMLVLLVAWADTIPCQSVVPTCPTAGHVCILDGVLGNFWVGELYDTTYIGCNGKGDCGSGPPSNGCNIMTATNVVGAVVRCDPAKSVDPGEEFFCVSSVGSSRSLNIQCGTTVPCDPTKPVEPIPPLIPIYPGGTGGTIRIPPLEFPVLPPSP